LTAIAGWWMAPTCWVPADATVGSPCTRTRLSTLAETSVGVSLKPCAFDPDALVLVYLVDLISRARLLIQLERDLLASFSLFNGLVLDLY
jgi:hypothetical protein